MTTNNPVTDRAREELVLLIERMCPDKPESNFHHPIGTECEALADAIIARYRDILAGQSVGDYVLVPREQIERLATKEPGYGMAYHAKGIGSNGSAEIHLYGKRAEAAHWLMENGMSLAAPITPASDSPAIPEQWRCPNCHVRFSRIDDVDAHLASLPTPASHTAPDALREAVVDNEWPNTGFAKFALTLAEAHDEAVGEGPEHGAALAYRCGNGIAIPYWDAIARAALATPAPSRDEVERVRNEIINTPETADFMAGVPIEAAHQRERWGVDHDVGKTPFDWFWLIGYLAQKAAASAVAGDAEKAKHHTISTAAALANWHAALTGAYTAMRPGIGPDNGGEKPGSAYSLASALNKDSGDVQ